MEEVEIVEGSLVRLRGPETGHPLVFVHAFGDSSHCYTDVLSSHFLLDYRLIAVDLWGFGASPRRPDIRTVGDYAQALEQLILRVCPDAPVGLIGHSIAGTMVVDVAKRREDAVSGVFSIEGNLTTADAMFTGRAADFEEPAGFKERFLADIWEMAQDSDELRHYYGTARAASAEAMWHLGRDAKRISENDALGAAFVELSRPKIYYWSAQSTPKRTAEWIERTGIPNKTYTDAGHWPMVSQPEAVARAVAEFFDDSRLWLPE